MCGKGFHCLTAWSFKLFVTARLEWGIRLTPLCLECWWHRELHDSVCYGSGCTWGNIWRLLWAFTEQQFSRGQKDQLKATGLLTLISYLIPALPRVYTPANRPDIRISSFVLARGFGPPQGFEVCVSACRRWVRVSIIWLVFPSHTRAACENEKQAKERGGHKYLSGAAGRCSMRVIVSCIKGKTPDWCKTYTCFARCHICLLSPVASWAVSYLLFLSRLPANCDICSKMKAWAKSECQYPRRRQTKWTNGGVAVTVQQSSLKWKVTVPHCVPQKWPFLIRQQGTHLSEGQWSCSLEPRRAESDQYKSFPPWPQWQNRPECEKVARELNMTSLSSAC